MAVPPKILLETCFRTRYHVEQKRMSEVKCQSQYGEE